MLHSAVAWKAAGKMYTHPCCYLLNGYVSGWASGAFNTPLVGVEVLCATKGTVGFVSLHFLGIVRRD